MVQSRQNPAAGSSKERDRDCWPALTEADREALLVQRRTRLADIVSKACSQVVKTAMAHHVGRKVLRGCGLRVMELGLWPASQHHAKD